MEIDSSERFEVERDREETEIERRRVRTRARGRKRHIEKKRKEEERAITKIDNGRYPLEFDLLRRSLLLSHKHFLAKKSPLAS